MNFRLAIALALLAWSCSPDPAGAGRPHIVLVMADDQGLGDVGYHGHPVLRTPRLDEAAAAGLRFERFYAAAPYCSPTRASVLTGRNPNRLGVFLGGHSMRPQETTLAEALRDAGYVTGHFGKWHLGSVIPDSPDNPGNNGFDEWLSSPNYYDNDAIMSHNGTAVPLQGESSALAVTGALEWIEEQLEGDAPIFAVIWFGSPHKPHRAAPEDRELYAGQPPGRQEFYGELTGMDRAFGALRDRLTELGIRDETLLWYCSDNGGLAGVGSSGGLRGHKGEIYEGGLRVPAFLEWPARVQRPRRLDATCTTSDIYPTLLEIAGATVDPQPPLDGRSLRGLIEGDAPTDPAGVGFWHGTRPGVLTSSARRMAEHLQAQVDGVAPHLPESSRNAALLPDPPLPLDSFPGHSAWLEGDWKLHRIESEQGEVRFELYDLARDPAEGNDLRTAEPERVARLRASLEAWLGSVARSCNGADYEDAR